MTKYGLNLNGTPKYLLTLHSDSITTLKGNIGLNLYFLCAEAESQLTKKQRQSSDLFFLLLLYPAGGNSLLYSAAPTGCVNLDSSSALQSGIQTSIKYFSFCQPDFEA